MAASKNNPDQHCSKYVLIVDDDPAILDVYEIALADLGFTPIVTTNSREALKKAENCSPELVILDQRMPGMTGVELAREMRRLGWSSIPIIMVSAGRHLEEEALAAGATICIEKPFDVEEFIAIILECTKKAALSA